MGGLGGTPGQPMAGAGDTTSVTIGGVKYTISHVPTSRGLHLGARLANAMGPALAGLSGSSDAMAAVAGFMKSPQLGDHLEYLCEGFAPHTEIVLGGGGKGPAQTQTLAGCFDTHFAGHYDHLLEWLAFVIQWDLSSFLAGAFAAWKRASAAAEALSKSRSQTPVDGTG